MAVAQVRCVRAVCSVLLLLLLLLRSDLWIVCRWGSRGAVLDVLRSYHVRLGLVCHGV